MLPRKSFSKCVTREDIAEGSSSDLLKGARCNMRVIRTRVFGYTSGTRFALIVAASLLLSSLPLLLIEIRWFSSWGDEDWSPSTGFSPIHTPGADRPAPVQYHVSTAHGANIRGSARTDIIRDPVKKQIFSFGAGVIWTCQQQAVGRWDSLTHRLS